MLHKEFWGLVFLSFVVWIFVAGTPQDRINNACRPVGWTGNVVTSLSALVLPDTQVKVDGWFKKVEYGCRYATWRLFYQEAYNQWLAQQKAEVPQSAQAASAAASASPSAPAPAPSK